MAVAHKLETEIQEEEIRYFPKKSTRPLKAIRYFCFECFGWDRRSKDSGKPIEDVKNCTDDLCPLYDFRFGKNPFLKPTVTQKSLDALRDGRKWQKKLEVVQEKSHENR